MGAILWGFAFLIVAVWFKGRRRSPPLPPGPPGDPIIGHLRYIPAESPAAKFSEWSKIYGDVMHLRVFNRNMIILNTSEAANELMDKRGSNYNHRPDFPIYRIMGWDPNLAFTISHGKKFQKHRRLIQQTFTHQKTKEYSDIQTKEAHRLALRLLECPDDREAMLSRFSTSVIMQVAFGHEIASDDDPYLEIARESGHALTNCGPIGSTPVDLFPFLAHMPSWFPGTYFATKARRLKDSVRRLHEFPFSEIQRQMAEGIAKPSFLSYHLERLHGENNETEEEFDDLKGAAAAIYAAATDTTWGTMSTFILAMTLHPECQERAQQEIDALLNGLRLPEPGDQEFLPYVECILQETHRWLNITPLGIAQHLLLLVAQLNDRRAGIPHSVAEDDVYRGMLLPKGSLLFANTYGILRDESVYHDPDSFKPTRYLPKAQGGHGEPFPQAQFGFGRRICPGRYLADASLFVAMATILALYNVKKAVGLDGKEITPEVGMISGVTSHTKPYKSALWVRNEKAKKLLDQIRVDLTSG